MSRKLVVYIAMGLDGYIAAEDDNLDFLSSVDSAGEDFGYSEFIQSVDTLIWGRRTYDKLLSFKLEFPHKDKEVYVISRSRSGRDEHVEFRSDLVQLVNELKSGDGKDIYCDGGGEIVSELLRHKLIDRLIISVIPHLVGRGIRLFNEDRPEQALHLKRSVSYPTGLVQVWYDVKPEPVT